MKCIEFLGTVDLNMGNKWERLGDLEVIIAFGRHSSKNRVAVFKIKELDYTRTEGSEM